jgi:hypothetical protein
VLEETGMAVEPASLQVVAVETTLNRRQNLLFCPPVEHDGPFVHDTEVSEVLVINKPVETAFLPHTEPVRAFFGD